MRYLVAQFANEKELLSAHLNIKSLSSEDRVESQVEIHTPYLIEPETEVGESESLPSSWMILLAGLVGLASGYILQWYLTVIAYPLNIGGRSYANPIPYFPVTFACGILFAGLATVSLFFVRSDLPRLHHPLFDFTRFDLSSEQAFYLSIAIEDENQISQFRERLESHSSLRIEVVGKSV